MPPSLPTPPPDNTTATSPSDNTATATAEQEKAFVLLQHAVDSLQEKNKALEAQLEEEQGMLSTYHVQNSALTAQVITIMIMMLMLIMSICFLTFPFIYFLID